MTKETYLKSVDILLDAYNNETLFHGSCQACACGNLLGSTIWSADFFTTSTKGVVQGALMLVDTVDIEDFLESSLTIESIMDNDPNLMNRIKEKLPAFYKDKGFTRDELMRIEHAFESSIANTDEGYQHYYYIDKKKGQYIGLCAVLEVMSNMVDETINSNISQERLNTIATEKFAVVI